MEFSTTATSTPISTSRDPDEIQMLDRSLRLATATDHETVDSCNRKPIFISVEGNIGAGKTTLIKNMEKKLASDEIVFLKEPVDIWETIRDPVDHESILVKFYRDPHKYAFSFQVMAYASRLSIIRKTIADNPKCKVIICERSLDADRNIFAKMLYKDGMIDSIHFQIYNHFFNEYSEDYALSGIIYIDADPDVCKSRIEMRARDGESNIKTDYLKKCRDFHEKWLIHGQDLHEDCDVLRIHTNTHATYDEADPEDCGNKWINRIRLFVEKFM